MVPDMTLLTILGQGPRKRVQYPVSLARKRRLVLMIEVAATNCIHPPPYRWINQKCTDVHIKVSIPNS